MAYIGHVLCYQFLRILAVATSSSTSGLRFPLTDSEDYLGIHVACYEEVETSSADSYVQSSVMLVDMLSIPLKHPFTPSLTPDSPVHGNPGYLRKMTMFCRLHFPTKRLLLPLGQTVPNPLAALIWWRPFPCLLRPSHPR